MEKELCYTFQTTNAMGKLGAKTERKTAYKGKKEKFVAGHC
jgi:hypothetical protein